jgi:hypothetical protein
MITLLACATAFGFALGLRYKVLVLLPAMFCVGAVALLSALAFSTPLLSTIVTSALTFVFLQIGFIGGAVVNHLGSRTAGDWRSIASPG